MADGKHVRKRHRKKHSHSLRYTLFVIALIAMGGLMWGAHIRSDLPQSAIPAVADSPNPTSTVPPSPTPEPTPIVETVHFSASGDNLIHKPIYEQAKRRAENEQSDVPYDFSYVYENLSDFFAQFDVNWINQESLVNDTLPPSTYPAFSTPGECAKALYDIGFRVFALSNNHSYDKGANGISATLQFWNSMPEDVITTGLWKNTENNDARIPVQEVNGIKIAYLAYTEHTNGISINPSKLEANVIYTNETEAMQRQIEHARSLADVVVVGVHWGIEYNHQATESQKALAQQFADWGADVIIGTHPHVLQDAQWLTAADGRRAFVAYSLGNFISTQDRMPRAVGGILTLDMVKTTDVDGSVSVCIQEPKIHPVITHYDAGRSNVRNYLYRDYTPELAAQHGMNAYDSSFSYDQLRKIAEDSVSSEFLTLD